MAEELDLGKSCFGPTTYWAKPSCTTLSHLRGNKLEPSDGAQKPFASSYIASLRGPSSSSPQKRSEKAPSGWTEVTNGPDRTNDKATRFVCSTSPSKRCKQETGLVLRLKKANPKVRDCEKANPGSPWLRLPPFIAPRLQGLCSNFGTPSAVSHEIGRNVNTKSQTTQSK